MTHHIVFVAPFFLNTTLRFLKGTLALPDTAVSLISQDPAEKLPGELRAGLAGHWRIDNGLDAGQIAGAVKQLSSRLGAVHRLFGPLEQLQVPLAQVREALDIPGINVNAAENFRDKSRMKTVLRAADVACAHHCLAHSAGEARAFAENQGYPLVVKPPAGAGGKGTWRLDNNDQLNAFLANHNPSVEQPCLFEEFVTGEEHSFDSVVINGELVWHSISRYSPSPLQVMENAWIQWCVLLPRSIDGANYDPIRATAAKGLSALGLETGLTHMEWFQREDGSVAISEVGARPPGAQITTLLSYAHDRDFYHAWPRLMAFEEFEPPQRSYACGAAYLRAQGGRRIRQVHGIDEVRRRFGPIIVEMHLPVAGQSRSDSYEGDGYCIVRHPDTEVVENALNTIIQLVHVDAH